MRTTLTLDPDVAQMLAEEAHRRREPFKQVVNDAIRRGLRAASTPSRKTLLPRAHKSALRGGFDSARFNELADELDTEATLPKLRPTT